MGDGIYGEFPAPSIETRAHNSWEWFQTMCARLGVRQAFSQAHRPQGNGRAEVAGRQIITLLRKMHAESQVDWVEALPRAIRMHHDMVGPTGLSPYQIVFGRERSLAGLPLSSQRECEDAEDFFDRMAELDKEISKMMNKMHERSEIRHNATKKPWEPLRLGDKVWVVRPKGVTGPKTQTWWMGPATVVQRCGEASYVVEFSSGDRLDVHRDQVKPVTGTLGDGIPLEFHQGDRSPTPRPDRVHTHRVRPGHQVELLVHWVGAPGSTDSWVPLSSFLCATSSAVWEYCREHGIQMDFGGLEVSTLGGDGS